MSSSLPPRKLLPSPHRFARVSSLSWAPSGGRASEGLALMGLPTQLVPCGLASPVGCQPGPWGVTLCWSWAPWCVITVAAGVRTSNWWCWVGNEPKGLCKAFGGEVSRQEMMLPLHWCGHRVGLPDNLMFGVCFPSSPSLCIPLTCSASPLTCCWQPLSSKRMRCSQPYGQD